MVVTWTLDRSRFRGARICARRVPPNHERINGRRAHILPPHDDVSPVPLDVDNVLRSRARRIGPDANQRPLCVVARRRRASTALTNLMTNRVTGHRMLSVSCPDLTADTIGLTATRHLSS